MPDTTRNRVPRSADALARHITRITVRNPGDRSALRHSLGKPPGAAALAVHRIVVPYLPDPARTRHYAAAERAYYTVAALIASQPRSARDTPGDGDNDETPEPRADGEPVPGPAGSTETRAPDPSRRHNLGHSLARAVEAGGTETSLENHLQLLIRQNADGLYRHLPRLILQLRGDQVRIDWGLLIHDLTQWASDPRRVAKQWAQDYYRQRLNATRHAPDNPADEPRP